MSAHNRLVSVMVLSEQPVIAAGVEHLLARFPGRVTVVEEAEADADTVVLYDVFGLYAGEEDEFERVVKEHPDRVLALSRVLQPGLTARALGLGAVASVSVGLDAEELVAALEAFAAGRSNEELAAELYLSINTVKSLIRSVYRKLEVTSRAQAVAWGVDHGFPSAGERGSDVPEP